MTGQPHGHSHSYMVDARIKRRGPDPEKIAIWIRLLLGIAVLLLIAALAFWLLVTWLPDHMSSNRGLSRVEEVSAKNALRTAILQAAAGIALFGGIYWTGRNWQLSREGQLTDRFSKAVSQLGETEVPVRIGAIYSIARIARDSRSDRNAMVAVLADFVRTQVANYRAAPPHAADLAPDVQAALHALARRPHASSETERVRLRGLCLSHLEGAAGDWRWVDFGCSHLQSAHFMNADCRNAAMHDCDISLSSFASANLSGAQLMGSNLDRTYFHGADLTGADLRFASLEGADFSGRRNRRGRYRTKPAKLANAHLAHASLKDANFAGVDLRRVCCIDADQLALATHTNARMSPELQSLVDEAKASEAPPTHEQHGRMPWCDTTAAHRAAISDSSEPASTPNHEAR